jgi:uncharacterized protein YegL
MLGGGLEGMRTGVDEMVRALCRNPHALETAWISFITFDSRAEVKTPLQPLDEVQVPQLRVRPGTAFGGALLLLAERMLQEVRKNQPGAKGDFKPIVILITDGQPDDEWRTPLRELHQVAGLGNFYAIGAGDDVDFSVLREVTDIVLNLKQTDARGWEKLFVWISETLGTASVGAADGDEKETMLAKLPLSLEKVDPNAWSDRRDDSPPRQLFLHALCGVKRLPYLMRYRFDPDYRIYNPAAAHKLDDDNADFSERGTAAPAVASREVNGCPDCPHCGSPGAGSCGNCGAIFCNGARADDGSATCPKCETVLTPSRGGGDFTIRASEG